MSRPYEYYIDIVTKRYFHGVDNKDIALVLACFAPDATLTEVTTATVHRGRDDGIRTMFERLFSGFGRIWHGNFVHVADQEADAICSQFSVEIQPLAGGPELRYENANRFKLRDGLFSDVHVYMSGQNLLV